MYPYRLVLGNLISSTIGNRRTTDRNYRRLEKSENTLLTSSVLNVVILGIIRTIDRVKKKEQCSFFTINQSLNETYTIAQCRWHNYIYNETIILLVFEHNL